MVRSTHPFEQEEVMAYLDGEFAPERAASVAAHLQECAQCESLAISLRGISHELTAWTVQSVPLALTERMTAATEKYARGKPMITVERVRQVYRQPWVWGLAGAFAILATLTIWQVGTVRLKTPSSTEGISGLSATYASRESTKSQAQAAGSEEVKREQRTTGKPQASESAAKNYKEWLNEDILYLEGGPLIARSASLSLIVKDFGPVEAGVKAIAEHHKGYIADLNTTNPQDAARKLTATLRIPSPQLEAALAELKQLGRVQQESQSGEDVTKQYTDLAARLKNSRITEQRLLDVLRDHTGKVKDILETEQEIERVRGEIEQMEADQRGLQKRIDFATIQLSVAEDYKASLQAPPTTGTRFHNAAVEGFRSVIDGSIELMLWLLEAGPSLLLWVAILFFPARWAWKRWRRSESPLKASSGA
jgi:hypothetical protein